MLHISQTNHFHCIHIQCAVAVFTNGPRHVYLVWLLEYPIRGEASLSTRKEMDNGRAKNKAKKNVTQRSIEIENDFPNTGN